MLAAPLVVLNVLLNVLSYVVERVERVERVVVERVERVERQYVGRVERVERACEVNRAYCGSSSF